MTGTATATVVGFADILRDVRHMIARAAPDLADLAGRRAHGE